jgi:hypothetical protein
MASYVTLLLRFGAPVDLPKEYQMSMSPRVLAEVPGVNTDRQALLIGTPLAANSPSDDGFDDVGGPFSWQQSPSQISVGLAARQTTYKPSRSL